MGRSESTAAAKQQGAQSAQDQANAQTANAATAQTVDQYKGALAKYTANDPYQQGGEFSTTMGRLGAEVSAGEENSAEGAQNSAAARMGVSSSPQLAANTDEMRRESTRSFGNFMANAEQDRIAKENANRQFGVEATLAPAQTQANVYGSSISGAAGTGANQVNAAKTPGFFDQFADNFARGAGQAAAGGCWIAEELFGPTIETKLVRAWLNISFTRTLKGRITMAIYRAIGRPTAFFVRHNSTLRNAIKPLFDKALTHAQAELKASIKHLPHAVMSHEPQVLEVQRPDGEMVSDAHEYPPMVIFPEDLALLGDLTLTEQGMFMNLLGWCFKPLQVSASWKRPQPGCFPLDARTVPVLWDFAGCHRPEVWEASKERVLAKFDRSADGKWLISPAIFMRWKIVKRDK